MNSTTLNDTKGSTLAAEAEDVALEENEEDTLQNEAGVFAHENGEDGRGLEDDTKRHVESTEYVFGRIVDHLEHGQRTLQRARWYRYSG